MKRRRWYALFNAKEQSWPGTMMEMIMSNGESHEIDCWVYFGEKHEKTSDSFVPVHSGI